jgi:hypothetical protein
MQAWAVRQPQIQVQVRQVMGDPSGQLRPTQIQQLQLEQLQQQQQQQFAAQQLQQQLLQQQQLQQQQLNIQRERERLIAAQERAQASAQKMYDPADAKETCMLTTTPNLLRNSPRNLFMMSQVPW